ncbi:hypothetical protein [Nonomuraea jabiensis]|uniref:hypothetical protein n=1 Tax=Nonomuraea jabiensis TaxID=882448 RepID=UPI003D7055B6
MAVNLEEPDAALVTAEVALALAAHYFSADGESFARFTDAAFLLSGELHLWDRWESLPYDEKQLLGRLLSRRPERYANPTVFGRTMRHVLSAPHQRITSLRLSEDRTGAYPVLGGDLIGFAERLLDELESGRSKGATVQLASPGVWSTRRSHDGRLGGTVTVTLPYFPKAEVGSAVPPVVRKAPHRPHLEVRIRDLLDLAKRLDALRPVDKRYLYTTLDGLFKGLRTSDGALKDEMVLRSGLLRLLNAPTGTGKSVLMRVVAIHLALQGLRVAVVVPTREVSLNVAREVEDDLDLLGATVPCTPLMSPGTLHEPAAKAAERIGVEEDWDESARWRLDRLAYGCALLELMDPAARPRAGSEPCDSLHRPDDRGGMSRDSRMCPWKPSCPKFAQSRDALTAGVVVTNHHNFLRGKLHVTVDFDGRIRSRVPISEFMLGAFDVVIIDEIDQFQSTAVDVCARDMPLSSRARWDDVPLKKLDDDRARIPVRASKRITPALSRLRELADQLVNFVADGDLQIPGVRQGVHGTKWQLPNLYDRKLIAALFGVPMGEPAEPEVYQRLDSLFPEYEPERDVRSVKPVEGPLSASKEVLRTLLAHPNEASLQEARLQLDELLGENIEDRSRRAELVNQMILKAWFAALQHYVRELQGEASQLRALDLASAREFTDGLASYALQGPFPYGPLGYALVGFRFTGLNDRERATELSLQTITGDPHAYTAQLGGIVSLTLCGHERVVLGLSATAFFPGAVREHIHSSLTWWMTDADKDAIKARDGRVLKGSDFIQISGLPKEMKGPELAEMGERLYETHIAAHFERMTAVDPQRARVALAVNSYEQCLHLARGIHQASSYTRGLCVAVPPDVEVRKELCAKVGLPRGAIPLTPDEFEDFPSHGNVLIAPMARIARGLNIVIGIRSALSAIFLCVRPLALMSEPGEMFASVNAAGHTGVMPSADPAKVLAAARQRSRDRLHLVLGAAPQFRELDDVLQEEVVAGIIVDLIQLAGRARRGGTDMRLYLADHAIHEERWRSDMATIIRRMYGGWSEATRTDMASTYGSALTSLLVDVAGITPEDVR